MDTVFYANTTHLSPVIHFFVASYSTLVIFLLNLAQNLPSKYNFDGIEAQESNPENVTR